MLTPADARAHLYEALSLGENVPHPSLAAAGVVAVFDVEPAAGDMPRPVAVTVWSNGYTPTEFNFEIRVYLSFMDGVPEAQRSMDAVLPVVDDLLPGNTGPENWTVDFDQDLDALVAVSSVQVGREDF